MKVEVKQVSGLTMIGKGDSNHWVVIDSVKIYKGQDAASRPMELLLIALGSCLGMDIISLLGKKRAHLNNLEIKLEGEEAKEHPRVFNKIDVNCVFYGKDLKEEDIKWAVERSYEKYCPVGAMLAEAVDINYSWEIVNL
ncbi:OsmC family protein [Candidatus Aerophobetes bacterium]|nr:OsmC family protein [Candidatus Aerophobetes bacterium]